MAGNDKIYKNKKRLQSARDARLYMQRVINAFDDNRINKDKARTFGYLIRTFIKTYEAQELEDRVSFLEDRLENYRNEEVTNDNGKQSEQARKLDTIRN